MILGVDIGGTQVKLALLTREGTILARHAESVSFDGYRTPIMTTVLHACTALLDRHPMPLEGIAVSATGQIDSHTGVVVGTNGSIPGYEGTPVAFILSEAFGTDVTVLNDANAAALGECFLGAGRGAKNLVMITLGTGVGGGIVLDGKIHLGCRGLAGELGHFTLNHRGPLCSCGKRGCFELYASTSALTRLAGTENGREVFDRAAAGDSRMRAVLDEWIGCIADGITGLVHIFNPELILIGGGVSVQEALLIHPLEEKVLAGVMPRFREGLHVRRAMLGNDAGLIGALRFFLDSR